MNTNLLSPDATHAPRDAAPAPTEQSNSIQANTPPSRYLDDGDDGNDSLPNQPVSLCDDERTSPPSVKKETFNGQGPVHDDDGRPERRISSGDDVRTRSGAGTAPENDCDENPGAQEAPAQHGTHDIRGEHPNVTVRSVAKRPRPTPRQLLKAVAAEQPLQHRDSIHKLNATGDNGIDAPSDDIRAHYDHTGQCPRLSPYMEPAFYEDLCPAAEAAANAATSRLLQWQDGLFKNIMRPLHDPNDPRDDYFYNTTNLDQDFGKLDQLYQQLDQPQPPRGHNFGEKRWSQI